MDSALKYIFWLSLLLIAVAYYVGTTNLIKQSGQSLGSLILVSTGRNAQGQFANYPSGG